MINKLLSAGAANLVKSVGGVLDNLTTSKEEKLAAELKIKDMIKVDGKWTEAGGNFPWERDANYGNS